MKKQCGIIVALYAVGILFLYMRKRHWANDLILYGLWQRMYPSII